MGEIKPTEKQKKFVEGYRECKDGEQAALRAGYSENTARNWKTEILTTDGVQYLFRINLAHELVSGNNKLMFLFEEAIDDIAEIVGNKNNKAQVRLQADKAIIDQVREVAQLFGLEPSKDGEGLTINIEQKQAQSGEVQQAKETINLSEQIENDSDLREAYRTIQRAKQGGDQS